MESELNDIQGRINGALNIVGIGEDIRAHLEWEAFEMLSRLSPDDLTTPELAALIGTLHAAHARVLGFIPKRAGGFLRIVPSPLESSELLKSTN